MPDLLHELRFGAGLVPDATHADDVLATASLAEDLGLDVVGFQDHPYQPGFLDAWTLLSNLGGRTRRIRLFPNVLNVPLRPAALIARSAASLAVLTGGRLDLGLGAGYFLDAIESMGGPRRTMRDHVEALGEAIRIIRALTSPGPAVTFRGRFYELTGARPGPVPPAPIPIWLGAYKRRMLQLTGRAADGWIPSLGYAALEDLGRLTRTLDQAAEDAGRDPADIQRGFNISGSFGSGAGFLEGSPAQWAEQLAELALEHGMSTFILAARPDAAADLRRFAEDVAPAVREAVAAGRRAGPRARPHPVAVAPEVEAEPAQPPPGAPSVIGRQGQQTLLAIHEHLRQELARLLDVLREVAEGRAGAADARTYLAQMTMRQNQWTLGAFCAAYCRVVSIHHSIEDEHLFPDLRAADQDLAPILARLREEHEVIAGQLQAIDDALVGMIENEDALAGADAAVARLSDLLLAHLRFEEDSLLGAIGRYSIRV